MMLEDQAKMKKQYTKAVQENKELQDLVAQLQQELFSFQNNPNNNEQNNNQFAYSGSPRHQDQEAVCEICREFLNLKLRPNEPAPPADGNITANNNENNDNASIGKTKKQQKNLNQDFLRFRAGSKDLNQDPQVVVEVQDEYGLAAIEPVQRCAICGLSADEADKLQLYTGENLGEMFSCDGNCGHQFHVRCVGKSVFMCCLCWLFWHNEYSFYIAAAFCSSKC